MPENKRADTDIVQHEKGDCPVQLPFCQTIRPA